MITKDTIKHGIAGIFPKLGDEVTVHYTKKLISRDAAIPDKTLNEHNDGHGDEPLRFRMGDGQVLAVLEEAVASMVLGERALFHLTSDMEEEDDMSNGDDYHHGNAEEEAIQRAVLLTGENIPPNSHLAYEMELVHIDVPMEATPDPSADLMPRA